MSRKHENEHPELVKLCTNCPEKDCDGEPCTAYMAMARMVGTKRRAESRFSAQERPAPAEKKINLSSDQRPGIMIEKVIDPENEEGLEQKRDLLKKYNDAIRGLDALTRDAGFENSPEYHAALELQRELEKSRREKFEILVDWDEIAERRKK